MRILVTGGAGFIGSHTTDLLLEKGYEVRIMDGLVPPVHEAAKWPDYVPAGVERIKGDVREKTIWEQALKGIDAVFHLAAYQDYLPDFSKFFHVNAVSTALLYEVIVEKRLPVRKVIVASSQATYGEAKYECRSDRCREEAVASPAFKYPSLRSEEQLKRRDWDVHCPDCGAVLEWSPTDEALAKPHNQYAMSKFTQEMIALTLGRRYNIPSVAMRYSIVQGARQSFRNAYSGILRIFAQRILNGQAPTCFEDGRQLRDYVSVHDVARANLLVLEDARADYEPFNVGGDRQVSVIDYARLVAERAGRNMEPSVPGLYRFGDTRHVVSDISKLRALGWSPQVSMAEIVDEYLGWAERQDGFRDYSAEAEAKMKQMGTIRET